jgi:hypothetical protein
MSDTTFVWRTTKGRWVPVATMAPRLLRQILRSIERKGNKYGRWWYIFSEEIGRRTAGDMSLCK